MPTRPEDAAAIPAGEREQRLAAAKRLLIERKPREAIPALASLIDADRDDLATSAEALVRLVECFQLLKGDAASDKRYAELTGKYLTTPPALDGTSLPTLDQAKEDLLWKPWDRKRAGRFTAKIDRVKRERSISDGKTNEHLSLGFALTGAARATAAHTARTGGGDPAPVFTAKDGAGRWYSAKPSFMGGFGGSAVSGWLTFTDVPADVREFTTLSGTVILSQPKEIKRVEVELRKGETWKSGDGGEGSLRSVETIDGNVEVVIVEKAAKAERGRGGSTSSSSSRASSGGITDSPWHLLTSEGKRIAPNGQSVSGNGSTTTTTLTFRTRATKLTLGFDQVLSVSTREVPIVIEHIALP